MPLGSLFTVDFLDQGITGDAAWGALGDQKLDALVAQLRERMNAFPRDDRPHEATTEKDLIHPVLEALGWFLAVQETAGKKGRADVPDAMLCGDAAAKAAAHAEKPGSRYRHALAILESKRWERLLDRGPDVDGVPSIQILRYLSLADVLSERQAQWGILTNGRLWRLYWQGAKSRSEEFLEIDLADLLGHPPAQPDLLSPPAGGDDTRRHWLRVFVLLFGRDAFRPDGDGRTLHQRALDQSRDWEARVAAGLGKAIFEQIFPTLVDALVRGDPLRPTVLTARYLGEVRDAALTLLYRLLFLLYAEDRDLLPVRDPRYDDYSLKKTVREPVRERVDRGDAFSSGVGPLYGRCRDLFGIIDEGDRNLGIPPYDGGLFERERAPLLDRVVLPDAVFAPLIDGLSRREEAGGRRWINYRDLSVQQLGTIYERLLEFEPVAAEEHSLGKGEVPYPQSRHSRESGNLVPPGSAGDPRLRGDDGSGKGDDGSGRGASDRLVDIRPNAFARKASGSYYTPESLVRLILDRTVGPLIAERRTAFGERAAGLKGEAGPVAERRLALEALDPASALLDLRICDPAMGSGHFLVSLVDYLADAVLESVAEARITADWAGYESPLLGRIAVIRDGIRARADREGWIVGPGQLDDRLVVRRMVLKRVVHGVDKNPMAVELAKLALWLHTFTVGAPLSFLDHHLRCGDSLFGETVRGAMDTLRARFGLLINPWVQKAAGAAAGMARIEATTDADIVEAASSADTFADVERDTEPLRTLLDALQAERWLAVLGRAPKRDPRAEAERAGKPAEPAALAAWDRAMAFRALFDGSFGPDVIGILEGRAAPHPPEVANQPSLLGNGAARQTDMLRARAVDAHAFAALGPLLAELRGLAAQQRFLHWEAAFPNLWRDWPSAAPSGGFDAVIGNPPYVRQEDLAAQKPVLKQLYDSYDGTADLYVYFYERALRLLRPGGALSFVVTNKWMRAGYGEPLRRLFAEQAWVEFVADFGHAKQFFPDADVFPCVIVARRPDARPAPPATRVAVIAREHIRPENLSAQVEADAYELERGGLGAESWVLEPPEVVALLDKIRSNGVPLVDYAGVKTFRGVTTGCNEAFLIDSKRREQIIAEDPASREIIQPYLRGADVHRWAAAWADLWMIFTRRGIQIESYPSVLRHLEKYREKLEPRPANFGDHETWRGRKEGNYRWYEIQDSTEYFDLFKHSKIYYQEIQYHSAYAFDDLGLFGNNKTSFISSSDTWLMAVLNSPLLWWNNWRYLPQMKDGALAPLGFKMEQLPVAAPAESGRREVDQAVSRLVAGTRRRQEAAADLLDWLKVEHEVAKPSRVLQDPFDLSSDAFVAEVRNVRGARKPLSPAALAALRGQYVESIEPIRTLLAEAGRLERRLSDLVNSAYGLTPDEVDLMWRTAPPRMPLAPAAPSTGSG